MTRLTRMALSEPSVTVLVMLLLLAAGIVAALSLNQELIPDIDFPQATVVAIWPGASADQVTQAVVKPIENALEGLQDVTVVEVSSRASDSFASVTVRTEFGTTQDELRNAIDERLVDVELPDDVQDLQTVLFDFSDFPVVLESANGDIPLDELQRLMNERVLPELEAIDGVGGVSVLGGREDKVFVTVDPDKMAEAGVSLDAIGNVLRANNISFPVGTMNEDGLAIPLQVGYRIRSLADLAALVVVPAGPPAYAAGPGGSGRPPAGAAAPPAAGETTAAAGGEAGPGEAAPEEAASEEAAAGQAVSSEAVSGEGASGEAAAGEEGASETAASEAARAGPEQAPAQEPVAGPFPLPPLLQSMGLETTDDITADLVTQLAASNPELLRSLARQVIESLPRGAFSALPPDVVAALPDDIRAELLEKVGPAADSTSEAGAGAPVAAAVTEQSEQAEPARSGEALGESEPGGGATATGEGPSTAGRGPSTAGGPPVRRLRAVVVGENDTLESIARRFGADPDEVREINGLGPGRLTVGRVLRVPLATEPGTLPPAWRGYGVRRASEITPAIMRRALAELPSIVSDLAPDQLLDLPPETIAQLPNALIQRQGQDVEQALREREASGSGSGTPPELPRSDRTTGELTTEEEPAVADVDVGAAAEERVPAAEDSAQATAQVQAPTPTPKPAQLAEAGAADAEPELISARSEPVTLGDIATIERAPETVTSYSRTNGEPSLMLMVVKDQRANTVRVVDDVKSRLDELADEPEFSEVTFDTVFEQASFIKESLSGVIREGTLGAVFAVLVILVFLAFSVRSTIVTAISIPLSVCIALLVMRVQGLTLNLLTLSGLTVAIGRVVDDSIVVLENVYRHIQRGEQRIDAILEGTREVASAITASTLVTVAVFLPLGFIGGLTSQFFLPFGITVTYALLASLAVAVTIVPVLSRMLLSRDVLPEERETRLQRLYTPTLEWALDNRLVTLLLAFAFFAASLVLVRFIPQTFMPDFGEPTINIEMALRPGTALETTDDIAKQVEELLLADGDLDTVRATVGQSGEGFGIFGPAVGGDTARASLFATFDEDSDAEPDEVADRVRRELASLEVGRPVTFTVRAGAGGGPTGSVFDYQILSDDEDLLRATNAAVLSALQDPDQWADYDEVPIINLESNLTAARDVVAVEVDPARALANGLSAVQVGFALRQVLEGQELDEVQLSTDDKDEVLAVEARFPDDLIESLDALRDFKVSGPAGPVRLGDVAMIERRPGPVVITRVDGQRAALIRGEITVDDTLGVIAHADEIVQDLGLPDGVAVGAGVESSQQQEGFADMLIALPVSIAIVYLIMAVTFGSLVQPFTILFSLPFALSGALVGLAVTRRALSISSLIGVLMLVGIVVTNAIVLVDLVQQYRARGMGTREALVRGGRTRLRPILMTAVATVFALFPMALGFTEGAIIAAELATVVIGGLITSTLLTLIVVPVVYSLLDELSSGGPRQRPLPEEQPRPPGAHSAPGARV